MVWRVLFQGNLKRLDSQVRCLNALSLLALAVYPLSLYVSALIFFVTKTGPGTRLLRYHRLKISLLSPIEKIQVK